MTIDNGCWPSQFVVYSYDNDEDPTWGSIAAMTTENCDTENWEADAALDNPSDLYGKAFVAVSSLLRWLMELISKIFKLG